MQREEWAAIAEAICQTWIGIDDAEALAWYDLLDDLDAGLVAQAVIAIQGAGEQPTATTLRKHAYRAVREAAAADPHPAAAGGITFAEFCKRGCPGLREKLAADSPLAAAPDGQLGGKVYAAWGHVLAPTAS